MSTIKVSGNPTTNNNTLVVNFTTDASNISDILLSKDGGKNYISATSFTDTSAFFNINTWADGTYTDCMLLLMIKFYLVLLLNLTLKVIMAAMLK